MSFLLYLAGNSSYSVEAGGEDLAETGVTDVLDLDACKSYKTLENLNKALINMGFKSHRHVIAYTSTGRVTAIFPGSNVTGPNTAPGCQGDLMLYARQGFMTLG